MLTKQKRIELIKEEIENKGFLNISKTNLANQFNVSRTTIHSDINQIIKDYKPEFEISKPIINNLLRRSLIKTSNLIENSNDERIILHAIEVQGKTIERLNNIFNIIHNKDEVQLPAEIIVQVHK